MLIATEHSGGYAIYCIVKTWNCVVRWRSGLIWNLPGTESSRTSSIVGCYINRRLGRVRNYLIGMVGEDNVSYFLLEIVNTLCQVLSISRVTGDHVGVSTSPRTVGWCVVAVDTET